MLIQSVIFIDGTNSRTVNADDRDGHLSAAILYKMFETFCLNWVTISKSGNTIT